MLHLRKCLVSFGLFGMVVTACGSSPTAPNPQKQRVVGRGGSSEPSKAVTPTRNRVAAAPRSTSPTTVPFLKVLPEIAKAMNTLFPPPTLPTKPVITLPPAPVLNASCPAPISPSRCPEFSSLFDDVFGCASAWAQSVAWRESNCRPTAMNGSSGSAGLMQLYQHDDILAAVCPGVANAWAVPECNLRAAKRLYDGSGTQPWRN